jgi:polar amino acid transport system substrate-binding protein
VDGLRGFVRRDDGLLVDNVEINSLIEACVRLVHNEVHKHADIRMELGDDVPPFNGNAQKIEQVLINLLVNAGQSIPDDTRGCVSIRSRCSGNEVEVEVEDNGRGMNDKVLRQIFDPFFTTKRAKGGTGLGLAISYKIIEEHGGVIQVSSRPGHGTLFRIRIPSQPSAGGTDTDARDRIHGVFSGEGRI